jgi:hypothetical protein
MTPARRRAAWALAVLVAMFAGLQFTNPARTNPVTDDALAIERQETVPASVVRMFDAACRDCHSNRTNWRWYTAVAPVSWWTVGHVNEGRAELNFSEWGTYSPRLRETRLRAMCAEVKNRMMPLPSYVLGHPESRVSDREIQQLCAWTELAIADR